MIGIEYRQQLRTFGALYLVKKRGGMMNLLSEVYPDYLWDQEKFSHNTSRKTTQWHLYKIFGEIIPHLEILEDYVHPFLHFKDTGRPMYFDVYVPSLSIAMEYCGYHHYHDHPLFGNAPLYQKRDEEKRSISKSAGITIVEIPYWWQHDKESIQATLHLHRPDVVW